MNERRDDFSKLTPEQRELLLRRARRLAAAEAPERVTPRRNDSNLYPLSFAQQRLWFLDRLNPGNPFYNVAIGTRLTGPLDERALLAGLREIVRRHDALRTRFTAGDGTGAQVVSDEARFDLTIVELGGLGAEDREEKARELAGAEARRPYNLETDPMLRVMLIGLGDEEHVLIRTMHHIMCDGWSLGVFNRELEILYDAYRAGRASPLEVLPLRYADFAVWQREWLEGEEMRSQLAWWLEQLEGAETVLRIPADRARPPIQTFKGAVHSFTISSAIRDRLKEMCEGEGITPYMALLAAFQALLHRYTGQRSIVVGSPVANRNRSEIEGLIGFFANTLALRSDFSHGLTYRELARRVREYTLGAFARQDLPLEKLVDSLKLDRSLARTPLVQVAFALQNAPRQELRLSGLSAAPFPIAIAASIFDATMHVWESAQGFSCLVEYATDLFDEATIALMCGDFRSLVETVAENPDTPIERLAIPASTAPEELERKRRIASREADLGGSPGGSRAERLQAILAAHPRIERAAVLSRGGGSDGGETVAYAVPKGGSAGPSGAPEEYRLPNGMAVFHLNRNETEFMYREIFEDCCYLKHGIALREGACVLDIGANIGLFSLFASLACETAAVYAFEPVFPLFEILKANADRYGPNIRAINLGLSDAKRAIPVTYYPRSSIQSGYRADEAWDRAVLRAYAENEFSERGAAADLSETMREELLRDRLRSDTLICRFDSLSNVLRLLDLERVDLLKIDVEKSELDVLAGVAEEDWRRIGQVVMEIHDVDGRVGRVAETLRSKGYAVVVEQDPFFGRTGIHTIYAGERVRRDEGRRAAPMIAARSAARGIAPLSAVEILSFLRARVGEEGPLPRIEICDAIPEGISGVGAGEPGNAVEREPSRGAAPQPIPVTDHLSLVVSATFTAEPIAEHLQWFLRQGGIEADVSFAPYNQVFQQLLDEESISSRNTGANVMLVRFEDFLRGRTDQGEPELIAALDEANARLLSALRAGAKRSRAIHIVALLPSAGEGERGPLPIAAERRIDELAGGLRAAVSDEDNVHVFDLRSIGELYCIEGPFDRRSDQLAHMPFSSAFYAAIGASIARIVWSWRKPPFKAIVTDCDNTLWKGVCGEDGAEGVRAQPLGDGKPFHDLQNLLKDRVQNGMLLALCSKNEEADVWSVFEKNGAMALAREDIAIARINWRPKSENIKEIARELNIGLDSLIFLDDEPAEIAEVRANCPEVLSLQIPREPACIAPFLRHVWAFDQFKVTDVDRERSRMYREEQERRTSMERAPSLKDFLASLDLTMAIRAPRSADLDRMAQLTLRTNQFNMNGARRSVEEIREYIERESGTALVVELRDRFGYYGVVGLLMFREKPPELVLDTFLLSCRALGKGVEDAMLEELRRRYAATAITDFVARYIPTERNTPFRQFLDRTGWRERPENEDRSLSLADPGSDCAHVAVLRGRSLVDEGQLGARTAPKREADRAKAPPDLAVHHIGIAVPALDEGRASLRSIGFACGESVHDHRRKVVASMCETPAGARIELIGGVDGDSPCKRILETGGGPYHLGVRVERIDSLLAHLTACGCRFTVVGEPASAPLFGGGDIAFVDVIGLGLMELIEGAAEGDRTAGGAGDGAVAARMVAHDAAETQGVLECLGYELHGGAEHRECGARTQLFKRRGSIDIEIVEPLDARTREYEHLTRRGTSLLEILIETAPEASDPSSSERALWEENDLGGRYGVMAGARRAMRLPGVPSVVFYVAGEGALARSPCIGWDAGGFNRNALKRREYLIPLEYHTGALLLELPPRERKSRSATAAAAYFAPRTEVERTVAALWERLLGVDRIGTADDFFKIGGNSILAVQAITRILKECGVELPLSSIFETPTVAGLAETIENYRWLAGVDGRPRGEKGGGPPSARGAHDETVEF